MHGTHRTRPIALVLVLAAAACGGTQTGRNTPPRTAGPVVTPPDAGEPVPATPPSATATSAPAAPAATRNYETYHVKVTGMTCPIRCVREVTEQLQAVPGVLHVQIDQDRREAIVDVAPGTDPQTLVSGLKAPYAGRLM